MFEQFRKNFRRDQIPSGGKDTTVPVEVIASGWNEFFAEFSGCSFNKGLYRIHNAGAIQQWNENVCTAFPEFSDRIVCFGYDWLGRHFALDLLRSEAGEPLV